ncbi:nuclear transport factor 2 family protein [Bacillus sp. OVS6]|uniref:nuclear transport factor 2 family protein n=1 Tax=Metabacillus dongyingensis TaxID=2874282 RepID=UPI001CBBFEF6|nr:nuclear transport factor 2 family protein [Metabacillus dongyingensis]UAL52573.1 nuclear transport factor 2 family protein [Metabacillus dongyingensis]UOK58256.1 nuclear transport factor 2 family protein [Bacillus sp. OVS6]
MFFFKKKTQISEQKVRELIQRLEAAYTEKDIEKLKKLFHPDYRDISFLNHFTLMMNFQIYNIQSEIMKIEILNLSDDEATFTYTRKHIYTCVNQNEENGENPSHKLLYPN